jgi:hypothetical protein
LEIEVRVTPWLAPALHVNLRRAHFEGVAAPLSNELLGRLPALRSLYVSGCTGFEGGPGLGARVPDLADLAVEGCPDFSGAGLGGLRALRRRGLHGQIAQLTKECKNGNRVAGLPAYSAAGVTAARSGPAPCAVRADAHRWR